MEGKIVGLTSKTTVLAKKLSVFLDQSQKITKNDPLKYMNTSKLDKIHTWVKENVQKRKFGKNKLKKEAQKKIQTFQLVGYSILGSIGGAIILGLAFMHWKIRKAINHKRIL